ADDEPAPSAGQADRGAGAGHSETSDDDEEKVANLVGYGPSAGATKRRARKRAGRVAERPARGVSRPPQGASEPSSATARAGGSAAQADQSAHRGHAQSEPLDPTPLAG